MDGGMDETSTSKSRLMIHDTTSALARYLGTTTVTQIVTRIEIRIMRDERLNGSRLLG
jgi:hypothetical protein